ncbi:MAG: glycosyltransferase [Hyphomicrobiales bacterium]|nr:glycosyltransferase [Hyphomicrobiales bacterium]
MRDVTSIHVVPTIDQEASGPSYSVTRLCEALGAAGHRAELAVLDTLPTGAQPSFVHAFPYGAGPRRLGRSPRMQSWLRQQARAGAASLIHNHSLWMMPNVYPAAAISGTDCKLIVSPRGTLSDHALARSAVLKKLFWRLVQGPAVARAQAFHATSQAEYLDIRKMGFRQPVAILPNGVDVPEAGSGSSNTTRRLLFLGRLHPIKGLTHLLQAWRSLAAEHGDWELVIAGPDNDGHQAELEQMAAELDLERCRFIGPAYGADKLRAYREADLYVLPTLSENFGMTVAEALAAGTPVITTRNAPWQGLVANDAGWWIDDGVDALIAGLGQAMKTSPGELSSKGERGRRWMMRDFSWDAIAQDMANFYDWVLNGGDKPDYVEVDPGS